MEYRRLGKSGLQVSVLSYGSWVTFHKQFEEKTADELMGIAYDAGINFFDNAEVYALGQSERIMGKVLKNKQWDRTSYTVSSKAYFGWRGKENKPNQTGLSRKHLTEACHEALQRLQTDYLDLYFCHRPDKNTPIEEVVWTMNTLIQQGKILYWGTSEWSGVEIMEAHRTAQAYRLIGPTMEQTEYNLFKREKLENEYLEIFKNVGLGTTIFSPLASGLLSGKYNDGIPEGSRLSIPGFEWLKERTLADARIQQVRVLQDIAHGLSASVSALAIAWCIKNPNVSTAILGASKKEQLTENLKALEVLPLLNDEIMNQIEGIFGTKPKLPDY